MSPSEKDDRVKQFKEYVQALNKQFLEWATKQWERSPTRFWSTGMQDYLRTVAKVRREFSDVLADDDNNIGRNSGQTTPGGTPPPPPGSEKQPPKYEPQLSLTPFCNTKVIHFIRHGEGFHNVGYSQNLDARLTERGWDQAHALGRHMYSQQPTAGVQLVVVSPMARTLETAAGIFGIDPSLCAFDPPTMLMAAQDAQWKVRTAHGGLSLRPGVKLVAQELCRERLGPSQCDKRQALEDAQRQFPGVDFSLIESELDLSWEAGKVESESRVVVRGFNFLAWLMQRPETNIAVVTHSAFLWFTLTCFGNEFAKPVRENLQRWYENCEMRTLVLSDGGGMGVPDKTWFRGGEAYAEPQKGLLPNVKEKGKGSLLSAMRTAWQGGVKSSNS
ncbi:hypothetical protein CHLNCDRAFT_29140 [Chlorella variabilis]|uniref:Phosphoglycerate mutase-like protein n=1 Tax=Chlorella variabilis TaxID=554065 RepID=E1Z1Z3_CHLVA|nr:hypothetical protein CHLNCDRAFT_29140 [Chlorella variabilis]EFN59905.1 hypothetical protein CHLNCDRAFT_29140 [Chlorella variabilis]|eukprot:XP_005852007.1 hypothetical protein CHLNCDRAFT_29140 [Chlorella variabilis]